MQFYTKKQLLLYNETTKSEDSLHIETFISDSMHCSINTINQYISKYYTNSMFQMNAYQSKKRTKSDQNNFKKEQK